MDPEQVRLGELEKERTDITPEYVTLVNSLASKALEELISAGSPERPAAGGTSRRRTGKRSSRKT